jgi:hypothetical protein
LLRRLVADDGGEHGPLSVGRHGFHLHFAGYTFPGTKLGDFPKHRSAFRLLCPLGRFHRLEAGAAVDLERHIRQGIFAGVLDLHRYILPLADFDLRGRLN